MARNKYPGYCYCCGEYIAPGYGHFELIRNVAARGASRWRIKCVKCASGRILTEDDPGVRLAQRAAEAAKAARKEKHHGLETNCDRKTTAV